jgi:hypothetical protein
MVVYCCVEELVLFLFCSHGFFVVDYGGFGLWRRLLFLFGLFFGFVWGGWSGFLYYVLCWWDGLGMVGGWCFRVWFCSGWPKNLCAQPVPLVYMGDCC